MKSINIWFLLFFALSNNPFFSMLYIKYIPLFIIYSGYLLLKYSKFIKSNDYLMVSLFILTSILSSIYSGTFSPLIFSTIACLSFLLVEITPYELLVNLVRILSNLLFAFLLLSLTATIFSLIGDYYIFKLDDLNLYFYPFSFLYPNEPFMRSAGFFYEPGQFSFYISACIVCREFVGLSRKKSILLLTLGLLTQSFAHLIFILFYFIYILFNKNNIKIYSIFKYIALFSLLSLFIYVTGFLDWAIIRGLSFFSNPDSWQRFQSFNNVLTLLDHSVIKLLFGPADYFSDRNFIGMVGENPLTPLIYGGLMSSWPFYLYIIYGAFSTIKFGSSGFLFLSIAFLTLQRPYTLEFPYTIILCIVFSLFQRQQISTKK